MLGEGVKWFDFLCPFFLKFAALAPLAPRPQDDLKHFGKPTR